MHFSLFNQNMELASTSSLLKVIETNFFFLSTFFFCVFVMHGKVKSFSFKLSDEMCPLLPREEYYCLRFIFFLCIYFYLFFLRRKELEMALGAELHTPSLQRCSASWNWL